MAKQFELGVCVRVVTEDRYIVLDLKSRSGDLPSLALSISEDLNLLSVLPVSVNCTQSDTCYFGLF